LVSCFKSKFWFSNRLRETIALAANFLAPRFRQGVVDKCNTTLVILDFGRK